jgi:hypothetical protein
MLIAASGTALAPSVLLADPLPMPLASEWEIQSSATIRLKGDAISRPGFSTTGWHSATVPGTVVGALIEQRRYPDPYTGMNLRAIPGTTYPIGAQFALLPIPDDSPYKVNSSISVLECRPNCAAALGQRVVAALERVDVPSGLHLFDPHSLFK